MTIAKVRRLLILFALLLACGRAGAAWDQDQADVARIRPRLADRFYIEAVFMELFGPAAAETVQKYIIRPDAIMGGPCDIYEQERTSDKAGAFADQRTRCFSGKMGMTIPMVPKANLVREGYIIKACTKLSHNQATANYFLAKAFGANDPSGPVTAEKVLPLFRLFHPAETPPANVLKALVQVSNTARAGQLKLIPVIQTLCMDTSWQVL